MEQRLLRTIALLALTLLAFVACAQATPIPGPTATPAPASTASPTPMPTPTPTATPTLTYTPASPPTPTPTPTPEPTTTPTPEPTATPTPTPISTPSPAATTDLVLNAAADVTGYWSDGSANVELTATLQNQGNLQLETPVQVAVTCNRSGEAPDGCSETLSLSLPDGNGPAAGALTLRVPVGDTSFRFAYGKDQIETVGVNVPERILGVDRDVWECFSDTSKVDTVWEDDEGIGCGAWGDQTVFKWDQHAPIRISASGPDSFVAEFKGMSSTNCPPY